MEILEIFLIIQNIFRIYFSNILEALLWNVAMMILRIKLSTAGKYFFASRNCLLKVIVNFHLIYVLLTRNSYSSFKIKLVVSSTRFFHFSFLTWRNDGERKLINEGTKATQRG